MSSGKRTSTSSLCWHEITCGLLQLLISFSPYCNCGPKEEVLAHLTNGKTEAQEDQINLLKVRKQVRHQVCQLQVLCLFLKMLPPFSRALIGDRSFQRSPGVCDTYLLSSGSHTFFPYRSYDLTPSALRVEGVPTSEAVQRKPPLSHALALLSQRSPASSLALPLGSPPLNSVGPACLHCASDLWIRCIILLASPRILQLNYPI